MNCSFFFKLHVNKYHGDTWYHYISFNFLCHQRISTAHLNEKNLSTNSSWGFEHVLDTMNYYWLCPDERFFPRSLPTRWRCNHFSKKWPKSKSDTTFTNKKTSVTPTFCKRNFSWMNRFGLMNFLSSTAPSSVVWRNRKWPRKVASIEIWKHIFIACLLLIYGNFYAKKWKWIIIDFFRAISSNLE